MSFLSLAFPALCAAAAVSNCGNPSKRVEWCELDDAARQQYTDAIDRLWYFWQQEDPKTRTLEFAGYKTQNQFDGTKPRPASLDDTLLMNVADDLKVKDLMST
ncbi:Tyrosinase [Fusarium mexicanum]|uniref:Tyrosinase n=1 Tax=Fusarium mexicanum TaxID=751941 RepID=A0A8H5N1S3_9HYPO|nr:Tyrosinase [Fusarium mexicanum]